jgi:hypothetical protein
VREVQPAGGPIAGNTLINVYGSGFQDGAKVFLGEFEVQRTVVVNTFRIYGYTPTATSGRMDVRVVNPDGAFGVLVKGFTFEGPPAPTIAQAEVVNGNTDAVSGGPPVGVTVRGAVTVPGVTRGVGQGGGIRAQVGFAPGSSDVLNPESYTWETATYETDSGSGEADVYKGNVLLQAPIGGENREWVVAVRFSIDGGQTWVMADGDGSANGLSSAMMRRVFIARPRVDYCKLGPDGNSANPDLFYLPGDAATLKVAGQVYAANSTPGAGGGSGLKAQLGYGPADSDPRDSAAWTWVDATYKAEHGNNDEWEATLPNPGQVGTYRVAFRFSISKDAWRVCDADGTNDSTSGNLTFSLERLGLLTVANERPKPKVAWCKIGEDQKAPEPATYATTQTSGLKTVFAQVNMPGVTDKPGAGVGIAGQIGWGPADEDPNTSVEWNWSAQLEFNKDNFTVNDEWKGTLPNPGVPGEYRYAVRFNADGGPLRVCDGNGTDDAGQEFELDKLGPLTVTGPPVPPTVVGYCKLGPDGNTTPETVTYTTTGTANRKVVAQVFVLGLTTGTGAGAGVEGQLGIGPAGVDPTTSNQWSWTATGAYKGDLFDNDEYDATLPNPGTLGTYRFAYRFRVNGGAFLYCDADGGSNAAGFDAAKTGTLNVAAPPTTVGYCKLGPDGNTTPETVTYSPTATADRKVVAQVFVQGVTTGTGAGVGVEGQLGIGLAGVDPTTSNAWSWTTTGAYKGDLFDNDEYDATLPNPGTLGTYRFAYRFRVNGGAFLYCDADGGSDAAGFDATKTGTLNVTQPATTVGYCKLGPDGNTTPEMVTYSPTATASRKVVAQVFVQGVTNATGAGAGVVGQLGIGPAGVDPTTSAQWNWTAAQFKNDLFDNDEYDATLPNPGVLGTYRFAYRFQVNGSAFLYCDADGNSGGATDFDATRTGTLTVGEPTSSITEATVLNNNTEAVSSGQPVPVIIRGAVTVPSATSGVGQGSGVQAQVGFAPGSSDVLNPQSYTWATGTYEADSANGEADVYRGTVLLQAATGGQTREWVIAIRFSIDGGQTWVMADGDGSANGLSSGMMRRVFITQPRVDYCKLGPDGNNAPPSLSYLPGDAASLKVAGQVFANDITPGGGAGPGMVAQLGYGPSDSDPRDSAAWTWVSATYKTDHGNNDEWEATLPNPGVTGTYRVAFRFSISANAWRVCDSDGVNAGGEGNLGFSLARLGVLTVGTEQPKPKVAWCKIGEDQKDPEPTTYGTTQTSGLKTVFAQVNMPGVTDKPGAGVGIAGQIGWGPANEDPTTSVNWNWSTSMVFNKDNFGVNDEWMGTLPNPGVPGEYRYAVRFNADGGPLRVCDGNGTDDGGQAFELDKLGTLTVVTGEPVPTRVVGYCKLGPDGNTTPETVTYTSTMPGNRKVVAQVFVQGVTTGTGAGAGVEGQLGIGPAGVDPTTSNQWSWTATGAYKGDLFNNDEYDATLPNPGVVGTHRFAYRFRVNGGAFLYCDADGNSGGAAGFDATKTGTLNVTAQLPSVSYCKLGPDGNNAPETVTYLTTTTADRKVVAQVFVDGVTQGSGASSSIVGQLGWGPAGADPTTSAQWNWATNAQFKGNLINNDEYEATLPNPGVVGTYRFAYRFRFDGGAFLYCDADGHTRGDEGGFDAARTGTLAVGAPQGPTAVGYCKLGPDGNTTPEAVAYTPSTTANRKVLAQVWVQGVTPGTGAGAGVMGQLGWGPAGSDPRTSSAWNWTAAQYKNDLFDNDEYDATLPNPGVVGSYSFAYRFQVNGGAFRYCDSDGVNDSTTGNLTFSLDRMGALTVANEIPRPKVSWCKLGEDQQNPESITYLTSQTSGLKTVFAQVYMPGVTDRVGAGPGLTGQLGWGPVNEDPTTSAQWNWSAQLEFNKDNFGSNDEWKGTLPNPALNGQYRYAVRFSANGGPLRVCDGNGTDDTGQPFELDRLGQLTVTGEVVPPPVGYCKLGPDGNTTPETVTYTSTAPADRKVIAQVFVQGVTPGAGAGAGVVGQIGIGPEGVDPSTSAAWRWTAAQYKNDLFDNDEYDATLPNPGVAGTYRFAYRFQVNGGAFRYCDSDGNFDGGSFDPTKTGTLTVEGPPAPPAFCRLQSVSGTTVGSGDAVTVVGRVYVPGVTNEDGPGANLQVQVGLGDANVNASTEPTAFTWKTATYSREAEDETATDEVTAQLHPAYTGSRMVSMRYSTDGSTWTYCDKDGSDVGGYTTGQQHALTVNNHSDFGYCNLQHPFSMAPTGGDRVVYGQAYKQGVTDSGGAGAGLVAELGYGGLTQDPGVNGWTWIAAPYLGDSGGNDEFSVALPELPAGTAYMYRYSFNGGPYCYGDRADRGASTNGVQDDDVGTITP